MPNNSSLREADVLHRALAETAAPLLVVQTSDRPLRVIYANRAFERLSGHSSTDVVGSAPWFVDSVSEEQELLDAMLGGQIVRTRPLWRKDGSRCEVEVELVPLRDGEGRITHCVASHAELTGRSEEPQKGKFGDPRQPRGDPQRVLRSRLGQVLAQARRHQRLAALLMMEIERYDTLASTLGHRLADDLGRALVERLAERLRDDDLVVRVSDAKLTIVLADMADAVDIGEVANKLLAVISEPIEIAGQDVSVTACIGISAFPLDGETPETLLRGGEMALQQAKNEGGNNLRFFTTGLHRSVIKRIAITSGLRRGLERGELELHYQPKLDLTANAVEGVEALVRWNRPGYGHVSPGEFIPVAEESDLIVSIGDWVLRAACERVRAWRDEGFPPLRVSVNVSGRHFRHASLVERVSEILKSTGVDAGALELELTEGTLMGSEQQTLDVLRALKDLGVALSVDDFGTGYSSLSYLKQFPIDILKIDRVFVSSLVNDPRDREIVRTVIGMARALGVSTIAEGVETVEQLDALRSLGCDQVQGYLIGRPVPADELHGLLIQDEDRVLRPKAVLGTESPG